MTRHFVDRVEESKELESIYQQRKNSFIVYERRKIGKMKLLNEFRKINPGSLHIRKCE